MSRRDPPTGTTRDRTLPARLPLPAAGHGHYVTGSAVTRADAPRAFWNSSLVDRIPGQYVEEEDVEVTVVLVTAEYPAPPAIANAYINQQYKSLAPKRRGCVISQIAEYHAKEQRYNPAPGPYEEALIKSDVDALMGSCG